MVFADIIGFQLGLLDPWFSVSNFLFNFSVAELPLNLSVKKWRYKTKYPSTLFGTSRFDKPWSQLWWRFVHTYFVPFTLLWKLQFSTIGDRRYQRFVLFFIMISYFFLCVYPDALAPAMPLPLLIAFFFLLSPIDYYSILWAHYHVITNRI